MAERVRKALDEEPVGLAIADEVVVNDDLEETVEQLLAIIEAARAERRPLGARRRLHGP